MVNRPHVWALDRDVCIACGRSRRDIVDQQIAGCGGTVVKREPAVSVDTTGPSALRCVALRGAASRSDVSRGGAMRCVASRQQDGPRRALESMEARDG